MHPIYNSLHLLTPNSHSIPPSPPPPWQPQAFNLPVLSHFLNSRPDCATTWWIAPSARPQDNFMRYTAPAEHLILPFITAPPPSYATLISGTNIQIVSVPSPRSPPTFNCQHGQSVIPQRSLSYVVPPLHPHCHLPILGPPSLFLRVLQECSNWSCQTCSHQCIPTLLPTCSAASRPLLQPTAQVKPKPCCTQGSYTVWSQLFSVAPLLPFLTVHRVPANPGISTIPKMPFLLICLLLQKA